MVLGGDMEFFEFPKMARWSRDVFITEKIDGTNGQIAIEHITPDRITSHSGDGHPIIDGGLIDPPLDTFDVNGTLYAIWVGSKNRWIYPGGSRDNSGFAQWVSDHLGDLVHILGEGRHFGEWWGPGIQRGYGQKAKQFSLFNVHRWRDLPVNGGLVNRVPILYEGPNLPTIIEVAMEELNTYGSQASPGFMRPEGIVWWHTAANIGFKKTFESDEKGKGQ